MKLTKEWHWDTLQLFAYGALAFSLCLPSNAWRLGLGMPVAASLMVLGFMRGQWFTETSIWPIREKGVAMMKLADFMRAQNDELAEKLATEQRKRGGPWVN